MWPYAGDGGPSWPNSDRISAALPPGSLSNEHTMLMRDVGSGMSCCPEGLRVRDPIPKRTERGINSLCSRTSRSPILLPLSDAKITQ
jgi:hypothetical protein